MRNQTASLLGPKHKHGEKEGNRSSMQFVFKRWDATLEKRKEKELEKGFLPDREGGDLTTVWIVERIL